MRPLGDGRAALPRSRSSIDSAARQHRPTIDGFTRADLLVTLATCAVLAALVITPLNVARNKTRLKACTANLQQIGRAVLLYADDHKATLPGPTRAHPGDFWWWYKEQVKSYLGLTGASSPNDRVFACPADRGYSDPQPFCLSPRFDYGSYVFNGVTLLGAPNIAGWKLPAVNQPRRTLLLMEWAAHAPLSWHRSKTGKANAPFYCDAKSVVAFADGHAGLTKIYYDGYNAAYTRDPIPGYDYKYSGR
ncbi:MAG: type II secretion system protein [Verrucomicrobia bacterium]|nr:type II secretion system protein [Verrucomicrobiota bacterium]